ncbi:hypothetical protein OUZ56_010408 [Daphnia magna]|uniref:Uncharacterized protein n=1 Tax=Daphnia magna TaxID=35525 RepID=A0ABR0AII4_9CRUS|nr:hypothetical protein OUZ56_010408 [Daphnia magna]
MIRFKCIRLYFSSPVDTRPLIELISSTIIVIHDVDKAHKTTVVVSDIASSSASGGCLCSLAKKQGEKVKKDIGSLFAEKSQLLGQRCDRGEETIGRSPL